VPRVELRDAFGTSYQIVTLSDKLLGQWFAEWLPRLYPPGLSADFGDPSVIVWPALGGPNGDTPDWPADSQVLGHYHLIPRDPALALGALAKLREKLEQRVAEIKR
jgi:hypothetical protein